MKPNVSQLVHAVKLVGYVTGATEASYAFDGRIAIALSAGWSLAISPDDAGRFRLEASHSGRVRATMWCLANDHARLAELAWAARVEAAALVA